MTPPRFTTKIQKILETGEREDLGTVDLTHSYLKKVIGGRRSPAALMPFPLPPRIADLYDDLTKEQYDLGYGGQLAMPDVADDLASFLEQVGNEERVVLLSSYHSDIREKRRNLEEIDKLIETTSKATFEVDPKCEFLYLQDTQSYVTSASEAYESWGWKKFHDANPELTDLHEAAEYEERYRAWVRPHATPFAFATLPDDWKGLTAEEIREDFEQSDRVDIDGLIENSLQDHHEDACDHVDGARELQKTVEAWTAHAGSGDTDDLALETTVAAWNARQSITSHYPDFTRIVPMFDDVTRDEVNAFLDARRQKAVADLATAEEAWSDGAVSPTL